MELKLSGLRELPLDRISSKVRSDFDVSRPLDLQTLEPMKHFVAQSTWRDPVDRVSMLIDLQPRHSSPLPCRAWCPNAMDATSI